MNSKAHEMLPDTNHDEQAMQEYVRCWRRHLAHKVLPGAKVVYEKRVRPDFVIQEKRDLESIKDVRQAMTKDGYYQFWSAMQRRSQEMMWESVIDPTERNLENLVDVFERAEKDNAYEGSLSLDPELEIPKYHTAVDIHIQPGAYHSEFCKDDVSAGVLYEAGLPIYIDGMLGPDSDGLGENLVRFHGERFPDHRPVKILDVGCAVGNSTLPWKRAFPEAQVYAIDVAAPCLRYGHARARHYSLPVHFSQQNAEQTNFDDGSFDLIVSHLVLHETSKPAMANILRECLRLLRPGGLMLHLDISRGEGIYDQFIYQWETYNNNETFSAFLTGANLSHIGEQAGFERGKVNVDSAQAIAFQVDEFKTMDDFAWPVLVGKK
ncbi:MAG: class I SAM-dependent methyltransferase [Pseudomonadota bacterium]